jgi:hypothetical protein
LQEIVKRREENNLWRSKTLIKSSTSSDLVVLTALNRNLTIACPENSTTERREVVAEKMIVRFAFTMIHSESLTSISIPTLLLAQAIRLV